MPPPPPPKKKKRKKTPYPPTPASPSTPEEICSRDIVPFPLALRRGKQSYGMEQMASRPLAALSPRLAVSTPLPCLRSNHSTSPFSPKVCRRREHE